MSCEGFSPTKIEQTGLGISREATIAGSTPSLANAGTEVETSGLPMRWQLNT